MFDSSLVDSFYSRFVPGTGEFYVQKLDGSYRPSYRPISPLVVVRHLAGGITIGFPAVSSEGLSVWVCFDDDNYLPFNQEGLLDQIERYLIANNYFCLREGKRRLADDMYKQGHLWVFLDSPLPAKVVRAWAHSILSVLDIEPADLEIFPKQDNAIKLGNCVRGPLGKHAKAAGERGWFRDAPEDVAAQLEWLAHQPLNTAVRVQAAGEHQLKLIEARDRYRHNFTPPSRFGWDGPTVLEMMRSIGQKLTDAGDRYKSQCPVCAEEGHDKSRDNLHLSKDNTWFGCWYGGWQAKHTGSMIYKSMLDKWKKFKGLSTQPTTFKQQIR